MIVTTPTIVISKIKIRRGTVAEAKSTVFDQGEPIYTTDTKRLYVGTGTLSGGAPIGSKNHPPLINYNSLSTLVAEIGDLVVANNKFYQLTAANYQSLQSWADVSTKIDPIFFNYNAQNTLSLNTDSISALYLNSNTILNGIKVESGVLQLDYDTTNFVISANKLKLKADGVGENEIVSTSLNLGLKGGSGDPIELDVDPAYFVFNGTTLSLSATPPASIAFSSLSASWFGAGLTYDQGQEEISLEIIGLSTEHIWPKVKIDQHGRVTSLESSIYDILEADSSLSSFNSSNSLSSIFDGNATGNFNNPNIVPTIFTALSSDGLTVITLSSAGFAAFETTIAARNGQILRRFAIPIFVY